MDDKPVLSPVLVCVGISAIIIIFGIFNYFSRKNTLRRKAIAAVVSNGPGCAEFGRQILDNGGSAVDATIAVLLCEGIVIPYSLGVGGGFIAVIYDRCNKKMETITAREVAPGRARKDMFRCKPITGALSAGVPGEIMGYWEMHQKYGVLPWEKLFDCAINFCFHGMRVTEALANKLEQYEAQIRTDPGLREIFLAPDTGRLYCAGDVIYRRKLGVTLQHIAMAGPKVLYDGCIGQQLVSDIEKLGGIISAADLKNYKVRWEPSVEVQLVSSYTLHTTPLPSSGPVLAFVLNVMVPLQNCLRKVYWHRMIEAFKHAYGHRTNLGDPYFEPSVCNYAQKMKSNAHVVKIRQMIRDDRTCRNPQYYGANFSIREDHGTASMCVLAANGDAVSATSTINSHFGAKVRSPNTGIILNNQMDDFSTPGRVNNYGIPPSPQNFIKPHKMPMSSMCPVIVVDRLGRVRLLLGAAGGSKITTSVAQVIVRYLEFEHNIEQAVRAPRLHHQLDPMQVQIETNVACEVREYLKLVGHQVVTLPTNMPHTALHAIGNRDGEPVPFSDPRRPGSTAVIYA